MEWFILLIIFAALFSVAGRKALGTFASIGCGIIISILVAVFLVMGFGAGFDSCSNEYDDSYYEDQSWLERQQESERFKQKFKKESMKRKTKRYIKPQTESKVNKELEIQPQSDSVTVDKKPVIEYQEDEE